MTDNLTMWASVASAIAAMAAAVITGFNALTSKKQFELQTQAEIARTNPYVWADVRPRETDGQLLQLVVGNSGPTVATNVRVTLDADLPHAERHTRKVREALARFNEGHASLPPGRTHAWALGTGPELLAAEGVERRMTITIAADGPNGALAPLTYPIDMNDWRETTVEPTGSLYRIEKAIESSSKKVVNHLKD